MKNNVLYLDRSKSFDKKLSSLIQNYNLKISYDSPMEKIFKNENIILSMKRKYAFLLILTEDNDLFFEIKQKLKG